MMASVTKESLKLNLLSTLGDDRIIHIIIDLHSMILSNDEFDKKDIIGSPMRHNAVISMRYRDSSRMR